MFLNQPQVEEIVYDVELGQNQVSIIVDLVANPDPDIVDLEAREVRDRYMADRYQKLRDEKLVYSCDQTCWNRIQQELHQTLFVNWSGSITKVQGYLREAFDKTAAELQSSYDEASQCEHGCTCQKIENSYAFILSEIEQLDTQINAHEARILELEAEIKSKEVFPCEFSSIRADTQLEWERLQEQFEEDIEMIADWRNDEFELEDAVDQDAFEQTYGFKYESSKMDQYYGPEL